MTVLAIDQGTSATKAAVIDDDRVIGLAEAAVTVHSGAGGSVELDPYFVAPKMVWLREHVPASRGSDTTVTTTDVWLLHRLCGSFVTDVATASARLAVRVVR
jgi:sugar (pentulose or hexulose) kinase